jgi:hypothetical protein
VRNKASSLQITGLELEESLQQQRRTRQRRSKSKSFAIVPLDSGWGYQAITVAGRGAAIVLYALFKQRAGTETEIPITATVLKQCGVTRKMRTLTIDRLVQSGLATVRYRGKFRGCPLLTLLVPPSE